MKSKTYFDYSATTPTDKEVIKAMLPFFDKNYGNPSSIYELGQRSLVAIDESRKIVAKFLNCSTSEIVFTGSATEANNLAILGVIRKLLSSGKSPHIITTKIEHDAILGPCKKLENDGISVTYLPVDKNGLVGINNLKKEIKENTALISIMYANNEIGTIQPIAEIGKIISEENKKRDINNRILFHTDAVQGINYLNCDVKYLGVDMLSFSGHKIYGPKGIGVLYLKEGIRPEPIVYGGDQEKGLRSGTENVSGIVGISKALELIDRRKNKEVKITKKMRDRIIDEIEKKIPRVKLNGSRDFRLPNNINFSFVGAEGEGIVIALDQRGICVSTGSACSSKSLKPSHVLKTIGLSDEEAHCSLRITLGRNTTEEDKDKLIRFLPGTIKRLREISRR